MGRSVVSFGIGIFAGVAGLVPESALGGGVIFEDVTVEAGLSYVQWVPDSKSTFYCSEIPRMSGGAVAADFDGDGWTDLFVTRIDAPNLLFMNQGDGTFAESGASRGVGLSFKSNGCAAADFDNDGDVDIYVTAFQHRNFLYVNDGSGHFVERSCLLGVAMVSFGAPNGCADLVDGGSGLRRPPAVEGAYRSGQVGAAGEIDPGVTHLCSSAAFGDIDLDGDLDLHVLEWSGYQAFTRMFRQREGGFDDVTASTGTALPDVWAWSNGFADVNSDGWVDLLVAADFLTSRLLMNEGDGLFSDATHEAGVGTDENGMGSAIGDVDNDGDLDWFVTSIFDPDGTCDLTSCNWGNSGNRMYRNDGSGVFDDFTDASGVRDGGWGWGASFLDYDNDGDLDLAMTNGVEFPCVPYDDVFNTDVAKFWENDGTGRMTEVGAGVGFADTRSGKGLLVFDYDNDGDEDVFVTNNAEQPILYRNDGGNAGNWVRVNLVGRRTNRMGVGARVYVTTERGTEPATQMREVSANSNFLSQNEVTAHFGVGSADVADVRVDWPASGLSHRVTGVATRSTLVIEELEHGDCDGARGVSLSDFGCFANCVEGAGGPMSCYMMDFDLDGRVGVLDFGRFQAAVGE